MTNVDQTQMNFPRVTGYRVAEGRRVATAPVAAARPATPVHAKVEDLGRRVSDAAAVHLQGLNGTSWRLLGAILGGTAAICGGVIFAFSGHAVEANATTGGITAASIRSIYPTGRDRVLVGRDGDLRAALFRAAIAPGDIDRIVAEATSAGVGEKVSPGTPVDLVFAGRTPDDAYRSLQSATFHPRLDLAVELNRADGQLVGATHPIAVNHTPLRIYGAFGADIRQSLTSSGVPDAAADEYLRVLAQHVDTSTVVPGNRFDVIVEQDAAATGERRIGGLMYAGLYQGNGIDLQLSQWTLGGKLRWYDAEEAAQSHDNVQRPVPGIVSSNYGSRFHPILGYTRMHKGMDFKAGYGTPILAVQTGWVRTAGWNSGGFGNQVELSHGAGLSTTYSHMSQVVAHAGQLVQQGQVIGYVGATGLATGPHLHYELHQNGYAIDPSTVKFTVGPQLHGRDLAGYQARLTALLAVPAARPATQMLASR